MSVDAAAAIRLSVEVGLWCTALGLPPAAALGYWLARRRSVLKPLVATLVFLPLVLPPVVTGLVLLRIFGRNGPLGAMLAALGAPIPFTFAAAVLAGLVVGFPLYVMSARGAFEAVDPRYEEVSLTLGAPPTTTWRRITLPLALPGLAGGAVLAFARALGEFGATIVVAGNSDETRTIALAVYSLLDAPAGQEAITPLVVASVALSLVALLGFEGLSRWQQRRLDLGRG